MENNSTKPHGIANTSRVCYQKIKDTDLFPNQRAKVFHALKTLNEAVDYRGIMALTGIEAGSVGRTINQLRGLGLIHLVYKVGKRGYYTPVVS